MAEEKQSIADLNGEAQREVLTAIIRAANLTSQSSKLSGPNVTGADVRDLAEAYGWLRSPSRAAR